MAEDPIHSYQLDPQDIAQYDDSVAAAAFIGWQGRARKTLSIFYNYQEVDHEYVNPNDVAVRATQPNPDTVMLGFIARSYSSIPMFAPIPLESAPSVGHTTYFTVQPVLWSNAIRVDPAAGDDACEVIPAACKPEAELELVASPIASLEINDAPIAGIELDDAPIASLVCRINR